MRRFLVLLAATALLVPVALAEGPGSDRPSSPTASGKDSSGKDEKSGESDDSSRHGEGAERSIGAFAIGGTPRVAGAFVTFTYAGGTLSNVSAGGRPLFDASAPGAPSAAASRVESHGAEFELRAAGFRMQAHDNPNAIFRFDSDYTVRLQFPVGATVAQLADGRVIVSYADGRSARVFGENLSVTTSSVSGRDHLVFMLDGEKGRFDVHREDLLKAISRRAIGAEITIGKDNKTGGVKEDVVEYGNVTVKTLARQGNVTLVLSGHGFDGRIVVLNVDPQIFGLSHKEDFSVLFDNASIERAANLTDVLDADNDGLHAEYFVVRSDDGVQVILSVPHYSVHTLTLVGLLSEVPPSIVIGVVASAVVVAAGYAVLFRAPKRKDS